MPLGSLPKTLVAKTPAAAADVMADLNALLKIINGEIDGENLAESVRNAILPIGSVVMTARAVAATGYLLCQGQAISRSAFATLFGVIGTTYGVGDGVTTFNIPDLRGRSAVGPDAGTNRMGPGPAFAALGQVGGDYAMQFHDHGKGSLQTSSESAAHQHLLPMVVGNRHEGEGFSYPNWNAGASAEYTGTETVVHGHTIEGRVEAAGAGAWQNLSPYQILNFMIKV